jgi:membrane protease YdiL (CAAX protease family)
MVTEAGPAASKLAQPTDVPAVPARSPDPAAGFGQPSLVHPAAVISVPDRFERRRVGRWLLGYAALAYALSWAAWLPLLASRQGWIAWRAPAGLHLLGGLGPAIAAITMVAARDGRAGLRLLARQCVAWRGRGRWLALGTAGPVVLFFAGVLVARVLDGGWPNLSRFGHSEEFAALPVVAYWLATLVFFGYGEEIGWRGFAQPVLERVLNPVTAAAAISVVWAGWHLPLFGITPGYRAMAPAAFLGWYLTLLIGAILLAWMYRGSANSLLVVALFHAVLDIVVNTPTNSAWIPTATSAALIAASVAVIPRLRRAGRRPAPPADAERQLAIAHHNAPEKSR